MELHVHATPSGSIPSDDKDGRALKLYSIGSESGLDRVFAIYFRGFCVNANDLVVLCILSEVSLKLYTLRRIKQILGPFGSFPILKNNTML